MGITNKRCMPLNIYYEIQRLINYGIDKGLIFREDEIYTRNRLMGLLGLDQFITVETEPETLSNPQAILDNLLDYAFKNGILQVDTVTYRDIFDTKLMDCLVPRPSEVIKKFDADYSISPRTATDNYYRMSVASNYIRTERTDKNISWKAYTAFGELDITINLSKPEKDPRDIEKAKNIKSVGYPKCLLCKENEGYAGRIDHPARQNHRIIPVELCGEEWFLQYSPYVYYNEHCIVFKNDHSPMNISKATFARLLGFVSKFPHYFMGSNADLPIVGGSILSHDHFQGGNYRFAIERASISEAVSIKGLENVEIGIVKWPMSVIRLKSKEKESLAALGGIILDSWREYNDESVDIISHSKGKPHNTVTPVARYKDNKFELDIVLRNNRTSKEHPSGIFHPHEDVNNIKRENIGIIEVMGLAILPARLVKELKLLEDCLHGKISIHEFDELEKHYYWFNYLKGKYKGEALDYDAILKQEVGEVFGMVLSDAGVFKQDKRGQEAFLRFIKSIR